MKVGIIGSGVVGKTLANGFEKYGYDVMIGSRSPEKFNDWESEKGQVKTGDFAETANHGDMVVLAVKGSAAKESLDLIGEANLNGKTVIDTTNPIGDSGPVNGVLPFFSEINHSVMETLQEKVPGANFVKAFSCIGSAYMVDPSFEEGKPTMFIAGNDEGAKREVTSVLEQFGHDVADMGAAEGARAIEPLCMLWCIPGFRENQWTHAFRLMKA